MNRRDYIGYLTLYADVYGCDTLDKTVETIHALRRRDARSLASSNRHLRAEFASWPTVGLHQERTVKLYQLSDACRGVRPDNIRRSDLHHLRMIDNELRRRAQGKRLTAADWSPRFTFQ